MIKQVFKLSPKTFLKFKNNCYFFSENNNKNDSNKNELSEQTLGNYKGMIYNMRKDSQVNKQFRNDQKSLYVHNKRLQDHLVQLTFYMRHTDWKSQFIYSLLNYHKLGFKVVSDYAFLDSSSYMLQIRNIKQEDRWPTIRAIIGLKPRIIITGAEQIEKFFIQNLYFQQSFLKQSPEVQFTKKHINQEVIPSMQSLLWHPTLTYQTTFHTDLFYHQSEQKNYMLVGILLRNFSAVTKAISKNMLNIFRQKQRYIKSKQKLTNQLKNLSDLYLKKNQFFGGQKPNFIDFYLYSHLRTKWDSKYFKNYLQDEICDEFKRWLLRMGWNCEYVRDRVTVL